MRHYESFRPLFRVDSLFCTAEELIAEVAAALPPREQLGLAPSRAEPFWIAGHDRALFTANVTGMYYLGL